MSSTKKTLANELSFEAVKFLVARFNGIPSQSEREAMKNAGLAYNPFKQHWFGPASDDAVKALESIGAAYVAAQKAAVVAAAPVKATKATKGSGKTDVLAAKAALIEKLSAQGRTPSDIASIVALAFG